MEEFIIVALIAFAIISIIFFVKMWQMTNDIRVMRDAFVFPVAFKYEIKKALIHGDKERAKKIMIDLFLYKISIGSHFVAEKQYLEDSLSKIGIDLPEQIKNMEHIDDFNILYQ